MSRRSTTRRAMVRAAAAVGAVGLAAPAMALPPSNDQQLILLLQQWREGQAPYCAVLDAADSVSVGEGPHQEAAERLAEAMKENLDSMLEAIAATPADGLLGISVKSELVANAVLGPGTDQLDEEIAESLLADLRRLARQAMA